MCSRGHASLAEERDDAYTARKVIQLGVRAFARTSSAAIQSPVAPKLCSSRFQVITVGCTPPAAIMSLKTCGPTHRVQYVAVQLIDIAFLALEVSDIPLHMHRCSAFRPGGLCWRTYLSHFVMLRLLAVM